MHISFSSLLMSLLFGNMFIGIMALMLKRNKLVSKFQINFIITCLMLILIRLALPVEIYAAKTVPCEIILPELQNFIRMPIGKSNITFMSVLLFIWCAITFLKLIDFFIKYRKFWRLIGTVEKCQEKNVNDILDKICKKNSCKNKFTVIKIDTCQSPFIFGLMHPMIVLGKNELSNENLEFILMHEAEHYFHCDLWKKCFIEVLCIVYWWNPFVYILKKEFDLALELHNDSLITEKLDENKKLEYLECLLNVAKMSHGYEKRNSSLAFCKGATTDNLEQRFDLILNKCNVGKKYNNCICLLVSAMLIVASFSFIFEAYQTDPQIESSTFMLSPENAYILVKDNQYYIYADGMLKGKVNEINTHFADLPIYEGRKSK